MNRVTHDQISFTIPEELEPLLKDIASANCFKSTYPEMNCKRIVDIVSPKRGRGIEWFDVFRMRNVLKAFISQSALPPIALDHAVTTDEFHVHDGFHRYYASIAAGFTEIPFTIYESF